MVLGPLALLSLLGAPLLLGCGVLRALGIVPRTDRTAYLGWAWSVGASGTAAVVFLWLWTTPDTSSALAPALVVLALAGLAFFLGRRLRPETLPRTEPVAGPRWEVWAFRVALALAVTVTLVRVIDGSLLAVVSGDEANFWAHRAKILFHTQGFGEGYDQAVRARRLANADYPLLDPLLQVWTFAHAGRITQAVNRVPVQLFSAALVLVLAGGLRRAVRPGVAALLLLMLPAAEFAAHGARTAYADALVALGLLVALDAQLRWRRNPAPGWAGLAALGLALAVSSKHEGTFVACALIAAAVVDRLAAGGLGALRPQRAVLWALVPAAAIGTTWAVNARFGAANLFATNRASAAIGEPDRAGNLLTNVVENLPERFEPVLVYFGDRVLLDPGHAQLGLLAFLVLALLLARVLWRGPLRLATLALLLALGGLMLIFVGLPHELQYHLDTAAARVSFQLVPAVLLWIAAVGGSHVGLGDAEPGSARARALRLVVLGYLLWGGAASVAEVGPELIERAPRAREAFVRTEEERMLAALGRVGFVRDRTQATYRSVWSAVMEHVPEDSLVIAVAPRDATVRVVDTLRITTFPRRYDLRRLPDGAIPAELLAQHAGSVWILDLVELPPEVEAYYGRVVEGPGWALWH